MAGQQNGSIFNTSADAYNTGTAATTAAINPAAVGLTMNQYLNPHQDQVIDRTMARLNENEQMDLNNVQTQAAQAGAFGGARHGLVESELMSGYQDTAADTISSLNSAGFMNAAQLGQSRIGQMMQGGGQLVNNAATGLQMGQSVNANQGVAGAQQQALVQQILSGASNDFNQFVNAPTTNLGTAIAGVSGNPLAAATSTTQGYNPGMFDYMSMGAGIMGGGK